MRNKLFLAYICSHIGRGCSQTKHTWQMKAYVCNGGMVFMELIMSALIIQVNLDQFGLRTICDTFFHFIGPSKRYKLK